MFNWNHTKLITRFYKAMLTNLLSSVTQSYLNIGMEFTLPKIVLPSPQHKHSGFWSLLGVITYIYCLSVCCLFVPIPWEFCGAGTGYVLSLLCSLQAKGYQHSRFSIHICWIYLSFQVYPKIVIIKGDKL